MAPRKPASQNASLPDGIKDPPQKANTKTKTNKQARQTASPPPNQTPPTRSEEAIHGFNHGFNQCDVWIRPLPPPPRPEPRLRKRAPGAAQLAPAGLAGLRRPGAAAELAAAGAGDARARGHGAGREGSWSAAGREVGGVANTGFGPGRGVFLGVNVLRGNVCGRGASWHFWVQVGFGIKEAWCKLVGVGLV